MEVIRAGSSGSTPLFFSRTALFFRDALGGSEAFEDIRHFARGRMIHDSAGELGAQDPVHRVVQTCHRYATALHSPTQRCHLNRRIRGRPLRGM
ncbi:MAG: hypothetical protein ACYCUE_01960 [Steroidobacteraceae bacterium]